MANLADRAFDGLHFDEQIADFFEKVVKVVRTKYIGHPRPFQRSKVLGAGHFRYQVQDTNTATVGGRYAGKLTQGHEDRAFNSGKSYVGDHQGPFTGFQFGQQQLDIGNDANPPSFRIQDLLDGGSARGIVIQDKNAALLKDRSGTSTHNTKHTPFRPSLPGNQPPATYRAPAGCPGNALIE